MKLRALSLVLVVCMGARAPAFADSKNDKADKLFNKGKKLLAQKNYAEACPTFEEVDTLDPGIGAKLNVAKCYEDWGRLATAYRWYLDASQMATEASDSRVTLIKKQIDSLDPDVPRLTLKTPDDADPDVLATLTLDGKPVTSGALNSELRVDPGPHAVEFVVDGKTKKKVVPVERGGESEVSLDIPKGGGKKKKHDEPVAKVEKKHDEEKPPEESSRMLPMRKHRLILAASVGGAGVIAVGVAGIITLGAKSSYKDALDKNCGGSTSMCNAQGLSDTHDAKHTANIATVVTVIGLASVGTGVVLWLTAPDGSPSHRRRKDDSEDEESSNTPRGGVYVAPVLDGNGGGFALGGTF
ncbi:MAG TPA: hypothetical protein VGM90_10660 [Kofleriaceae bacterium]|jgi:hypothetical protein